MDNEQLNFLLLEINHQEEILKQNKLVFNLLQKINFFKSFFDADCLIRITAFKNQSKPIQMSILTGAVNNDYKIIDLNDLKDHNINPDLPDNIVINDSRVNISFKNNKAGYEVFLKQILQEQYSQFNFIHLERILPIEKIKNIKQPKI